MSFSEKQINLLESLGLPRGISAWAALDDDTFLKDYEVIEDSMLYKGVNAAGDGLNEYGELCRSILVDLADV